MQSSRTQDFRKLFAKLPNRVKEMAKKNYQLWQENPSHPSLEFKKVNAKLNIWSVRVRGCLKRVSPGIVCHQEATKTLDFEDISLRPTYNLRCSLAFQTPS